MGTFWKRSRQINQYIHWKLCWCRIFFNQIYVCNIIIWNCLTYYLNDVFTDHYTFLVEMVQLIMSTICSDNINVSIHEILDTVREHMGVFCLRQLLWTTGPHKNFHRNYVLRLLASSLNNAYLRLSMTDFG